MNTFDYFESLDKLIRESTLTQSLDNFKQKFYELKELELEPINLTEPTRDRNLGMIALKYGNHKILNFLFKNGLDIDYKDRLGNNLFHVYIEDGTLVNEETYNLLKENKISLNERNNNGKTPLMTINNFKMTYYIQDNIKNINFSIQDFSGNTLLMSIINQRGLHDFIFHIVQLALTSDEPVRDDFIKSLHIKNHNGDNILTSICRLSKSFEINKQMSDTQPFDLIKKLLDLGLEPNIANLKGKTALDYDQSGTIESYLKQKFIKNNLK